jgi:hypothetical protein
MNYTQLIGRLRIESEFDDTTTGNQGADAIEALQARVNELEQMYISAWKERDAFAAKLAALEGQSATGVVEYSLRFTGGFHVKINRDAVMPDVGTPLYLAAGAQELPKGECFKNGTTCAKCGHNEFIAGAQAQPLTDDFVHKVVRLVQPDLADDSDAWADEFCECKYWLKAAHKIGGSV